MLLTIHLTHIAENLDRTENGSVLVCDALHGFVVFFEGQAVLLHESFELWGVFERWQVEFEGFPSWGRVCGFGLGLWLRFGFGLGLLDWFLIEFFLRGFLSGRWLRLLNLDRLTAHLNSLEILLWNRITQQLLNTLDPVVHWPLDHGLALHLDDLLGLLLILKDKVPGTRPSPEIVQIDHHGHNKPLIQFLNPILVQCELNIAVVNA